LQSVRRDAVTFQVTREGTHRAVYNLTADEHK
jgi:hypothetical protein